jgi:cellulose synthase/poly-beta-1,6-N-acetylglucosamine synthase-like glycosyltransferase
MNGLLFFLFAVLMALPAVLTLAFAFQALGMVLKRPRPIVFSSTRPRLAVIVPAHDEAEGITATVRHLRQQIGDDDLLLVVADNCSDDTARLAKEAGAEVLTRIDDKRGKGYALAYGLATLSSLAHDVVVFVDADCRVEAGGLERLARACSTTGMPVQARYMMKALPGQSRLAEFFWRIRNDFRPEGYARLGLPCPLFGSGMALPVSMARPHLFATGHITEDLLIGMRCALEGAAPRFMRSVTITSTFVAHRPGEDQQRRRWIHGHLDVIRSSALPLLGAGLRRGDLRLLALAFDVMTPPLSLLAALHAAAAGFAALVFLTMGEPTALIMTAAGLAVFSLALFSAWWICGRDILQGREWAGLPRHFGKVLRSVSAFIGGRRSSWIRADRSRGA